MTLKTFLLIANIQMAIFATGAVLCFLKFKTGQAYIRLLGFALLASVVGDLLSYVFKNLKWGTNYGPSMYGIFVVPILAGIYYHACEKHYRNFFIGISVTHVFFGLINVISIQQASINSYTLILKSIICILFSLIYYYWLLKELPTAQLHRLPMFWVSTSFMFYSAGNLFLFVFADYLVSVLNNNLLDYWSLHNALGIIQGFMILFAIWLANGRDVRTARAGDQQMS